jgi:hypothetical protein
MSNSQNINISQQNVTGSCDFKCSYNFTYQESNSTATNNGSFISLTYDNGSTPPVLFNNQKYNVTTISIVTPSIHLFNNESSDAELYIEHTPVLGGQLLFVSIPIRASNSSNNSLLNSIIQTVSNNAPSNGDTTSLNISNFNLTNIIPNKPYFYYADENQYSWIVFDISNSIHISSSILYKLNQMISNFSLTTQSQSLFYNASGPNSSGSNSDDQLYISCQPVDASSDKQEVSFETNQSNNNLNTLFNLNSPYTIIIIMILFAIFISLILFVSINSIHHYFTDGSNGAKIASTSKNG